MRSLKWRHFFLNVWLFVLKYFFEQFIYS